MLIIGVIGSALCILAPALVWVAYDRMDDAIYTAGIVSLIRRETHQSGKRAVRVGTERPDRT